MSTEIEIFLIYKDVHFNKAVMPNYMTNATSKLPVRFHTSLQAPYFEV